MNLDKRCSLKYKDLAISGGQETAEKRGSPKNEGISDDVYENKWQKNLYSGPVQKLQKTSKLFIFVKIYIKTKGLAVYTRTFRRDAGDFKTRVSRSADEPSIGCAEDGGSLNRAMDPGGNGYATKSRVHCSSRSYVSAFRILHEAAAKNRYQSRWLSKRKNFRGHRRGECRSVFAIVDRLP